MIPGGEVDASVEVLARVVVGGDEVVGQRVGSQREHLFGGVGEEPAEQPGDLPDGQAGQLPDAHRSQRGGHHRGWGGTVG